MFRGISGLNADLMFKKPKENLYLQSPPWGGIHEETPHPRTFLLPRRWANKSAPKAHLLQASDASCEKSAATVHGEPDG